MMCFYAFATKRSSGPLPYALLPTARHIGAYALGSQVRPAYLQRVHNMTAKTFSMLNPAMTIQPVC